MSAVASEQKADAGTAAAPLTIFFTGATGNNGCVIVPYLRSRGHHIKALCRDPQKPVAQDLAALGVTLVKGDALKPEEWIEQVADCDAVIWSSVVWENMMADTETLRLVAEKLAASAAAAVAPARGERDPP